MPFPVQDPGSKIVGPEPDRSAGTLVARWCHSGGWFGDRDWNGQVGPSSLGDSTTLPSFLHGGPRDPDDVDLSWEIDAFTFDLPMMASAMDSAVSPSTAAEIGRLGGLAVLNLEGLWTRYEDPGPVFEEISAAADDEATRTIQKVYQEPIKRDLIGRRVEEIKASGVLAAASLTPQNVETYHASALEAGLDVLVIQGTVVSAEHVSTRTQPLDLFSFIAGVDVPVVVGGVASYSGALHLMRTGAVGVLGRSRSRCGVHVASRARNRRATGNGDRGCSRCRGSAISRRRAGTCT